MYLDPGRRGGGITAVSCGSSGGGIGSSSISELRSKPVHSSQSSSVSALSSSISSPLVE